MNVCKYGAAHFFRSAKLVELTSKVISHVRCLVVAYDWNVQDTAGTAKKENEKTVQLSSQKCGISAITTYNHYQLDLRWFL